MTIKASIVIPTFNRKETLRETLFSFRGQTVTNFEIVIADDGSSDGTAEMVRALDVPFPLKHVWQKNAGRSSARNLGVRASEGEIIIFVDDHNIAHKSFVEEHLKYHDKYKNINLGAVRGRMEFINDPKEAPLNPQPIPFLIQIQKRIEENNPLRFHTGNVSVTKEAFYRIGGFDEDFREYGFQDQEFGYRLIKTGYRVKYNPDAVNYIFKAEFDFEKECIKARQAGHSAVLCRRKHPRFGQRCGANAINLFLYRLLALNDNWWLRQARKKLAAATPKNAIKYREQIKFFYFLMGVYENTV